MPNCSQCGDYLEESLALGAAGTRRVAKCSVCPVNSVYTVCENCADIDQVTRGSCPWCGAANLWQVSSMVTAGPVSSFENSYTEYHDNREERLWTRETILFIIGGFVCFLGLSALFAFGLPKILPHIGSFTLTSWLSWGAVSGVLSLLIFLVIIGYFRKQEGYFDTDDTIFSAVISGIALLGFSSIKILHWLFGGFTNLWIGWGAVSVSAGLLIFIGASIYVYYNDGFFDEEEVGMSAGFGIMASIALLLGGYAYIFFKTLS